MCHVPLFSNQRDPEDSLLSFYIWTNAHLNHLEQLPCPFLRTVFVQIWTFCLLMQVLEPGLYFSIFEFHNLTQFLAYRRFHYEFAECVLEKSYMWVWTFLQSQKIFSVIFIIRMILSLLLSLFPSPSLHPFLPLFLSFPPLISKRPLICWLMLKMAHYFIPSASFLWC